MNQILLVAKREFITQVRNKTFIILTITMPFLMVLFGAVVIWMAKANEGVKNIGVIDNSGLFSTEFKADERISYSFYRSDEQQAILDTLAESDYLDALLVLPNTTNLSEVEQESKLHTNGSLGFKYKENLEGTIRAKIENDRLAEYDITEEILKSTKANLNLKVYNVKDNGKEDKGAFTKLIISFVLIYFIFMFIMIYGVRVMRSVVEEKNNRVVEIIISSLKPMNLMIGKMSGMAAVAVFQFIIWIIMAGVLYSILGLFGLSSVSTESVKQTQQILAENPEGLTKIQQQLEVITSLPLLFIGIIFLVYFVLGYLFYSSIFAAIGSAVDNDTDTQQFTFLPMIPLALGTYGAFFSLTTDPEGPVAFWLSIIPFTSPMAMIMRLPFGIPPWWHILLSIFVLVGFILFFTYIAAKIYRVGILMYGKKASYKEIWKWIRHS